MYREHIEQIRYPCHGPSQHRYMLNVIEVVDLHDLVRVGGCDLSEVYDTALAHMFAGWDVCDTSLIPYLITSYSRVVTEALLLS